jgi:four helix bundle protein
MESPKKIYDLEERTYEFAKSIRCFVRKLEINIWNREDIKQVVRSSGSVASNYIEANEKLGDKDFLMKLRISKKEAKETILWLRLIEVKTEELQNILGAIFKKSVSKKIT